MVFSSIGQFFAEIINILLKLGAVAALVGLVVGGYKYITSSGNPEAADIAKKAITFSILGFLVILLAVVFVRFLMEQLGVTNFSRFGL
jgi:NADH:ubiquinone oxidoreductase subunit 6 (subunit J)